MEKDDDMTKFMRQNWTSNYWFFLRPEFIQIERQQALDEGRDLSSVDKEFDEVIGLNLSTQENLERAERLFDAVQDLPWVAGYRYREPSDLEGIRREQGIASVLPTCTLNDEQLRNKALGAWLGRASGCLLGKPVEGRMRWQIEKYLRTQKRWPLDRYFSAEAPVEIKKECDMDTSERGQYEEGITCMVEDDDTNYTVSGLALLKQYGGNFTPAQVALFWLSNIPPFHVATAELVAYRNLMDGIAPPESARRGNMFREWIGAQIRADFFGYVNPGQPERAAEFAWRDACMTHVKNGIYGEMWVAAMLAAAYVCDDVETVIRAGLSQIPVTSRFAAAIEHILRLHNRRVSYLDAIADFDGRWKEDDKHHAVHVISNAEIVAIALLWGAKDFEKTICYSVLPGYDTDCNGATAGSVVGLMLGADRLPGKWITPLNDTLLTGVAGYHTVSFTQVAGQTVELIRQSRK